MSLSEPAFGGRIGRTLADSERLVARAAAPPGAGARTS